MGEGFAEGYSVGLGQATQNNGCCNNNGGGFGGFGNDGWGFIWIILIFAIFGWGNGNNGWSGNNGGGGVADNYVLATDFATIERKLDGVNNGLCDGFYAVNTGMLNGFAGVQQSLSQGFAGLNTGLVTQGYETRLATQTLGSQLADCCCKTQTAIQANTTQGVMNTNAIQNQIQNCCCDIEKSAMQTRFDAQQMNCATLQAIDKVGDRIIDYLAADKNQTLRDENQALRLAASQANQNTYLINQLKPCPSPAYVVPNPNCCYGANVTFSNPYNNGNCGGCC